MPQLNGMDSAASALRYWERKQEIVANNLANVSTDGFKQEKVFARLLNGALPVAETHSDMTTGTLKQTGNAMDVAMDGPGFFVVNTANGERYTRGGTLGVTDKHFLVDQNGNQLLGTKGPLKLGDGPVTISSAGLVTQNGQIVDTLRVENTPAGTEPAQEGESLWVPGATKQVVAPKERTVKQGYVEQSNVNSMSALIDMVAVQRSYTAVEKAMTAMDQSNETLTTQIARPL
jgi:flagellar basal-body rod protein FlgF